MVVYEKPIIRIILLDEEDRILTSLTDVGDITDENFPVPGLSVDKGEGGTDPWPFQ